jgi:hypothetical protein
VCISHLPLKCHMPHPFNSPHWLSTIFGDKCKSLARAIFSILETQCDLIDI